MSNYEIKVRFLRQLITIRASDAENLRYFETSGCRLTSNGADITAEHIETKRRHLAEIDGVIAMAQSELGLSASDETGS
jgi:hypothetical protein